VLVGKIGSVGRGEEGRVREAKPQGIWEGKSNIDLEALHGGGGGDI